MIKFDMKELTPWADIHRMLSTAQTLTVKVGDIEYSGTATLGADDGNNVVLEVNQTDPVDQVAEMEYRVYKDNKTKALEAAMENVKVATKVKK